MFAQDRDQARRFFLSVRQKTTGMTDRSDLQPLERLVARIIEQHPEYHPLLDNGELALQQDYLPELGHSNPFLHMGMHIAIHEQINSDRPFGIRQIWSRLSQQHGDHHDAEHRMMECLAETLWRAQREQQPPDEQAYLEKLRALL